MAQLSDLDKSLLANGYEVIPAVGKQVIIKGWSEGEITSDRLIAMRDGYPDHINTGIRTGRVCDADIDIMDKDHARKVAKLAQDILGVTNLIRRGSKGYLMIYRNETPIRKITITPLDKEKADLAKIEIQGAGQQFIAYGLHPKTGKPYKWLVPQIEDLPELGVHEPANTPVAELPETTPAKLRDFAQKTKTLLEELGYGPCKITGDIETERDDAASTGEPCPSEAKLFEKLSKLNPFCDRGTWRDFIAGIRNPGVEGDDERQSVARRMAQEWSRGDYTPQFEDTTHVYTTSDDVDKVFDTMGPKPNGKTVLSIYDAVQQIEDAEYKEQLAKADPRATWANYQPATVRDKEGFRQPEGGVDFRYGSDITPVKISWLWQDRIAQGKLTMLAGKPDDGKSMIAVNLSATVTNGGEWPLGEGKCEQGLVLWLSAEDAADDTTIPRFIAAGGNLAHFIELRATVRVDENLKRTMNVRDDLNAIATTIAHVEKERGLPVRLLVVDPISAYMGGRDRTDSWKNSEVRNTMTPILEFVRDSKIATLAITHFKKGGDESVLNKVIDSIALPALSRATFVTDMEVNEEGTPTGRRLLAKAKKNIGLPVKTLVYQIADKTITHEQSGDIEHVPFIKWCGYSDLSAEEAHAMHSGKGADRLDAAKDFLQRELMEGAKTVAQLRKKAGERHSWRTVQRAATSLKIMREDVGFGPGSYSKWSLPGTPAGADIANDAPPMDLGAVADEDIDWANLDLSTPN